MSYVWDQIIYRQPWLKFTTAQVVRPDMYLRNQELALLSHSPPLGQNVICELHASQKSPPGALHANAIVQLSDKHFECC